MNPGDPLGTQDLESRGEHPAPKAAVPCVGPKPDMQVRGKLGSEAKDGTGTSTTSPPRGGKFPDRTVKDRSGQDRPGDDPW
jgi:hypothetical protein